MFITDIQKQLKSTRCWGRTGPGEAPKAEWGQVQDQVSGSSKLQKSNKDSDIPVGPYETGHQRRRWEESRSSQTVKGARKSKPKGRQSWMAQSIPDDMYWMCQQIKVTCRSDDVQYFNRWQVHSHSHITTIFSASKNHPQNTLTKWFAALEQPFNKVFDPFMYAIFFPLPCLSAQSQQNVCHCSLHVINLSFDDLLLTHGTSTRQLNSQSCVKEPKICLLLSCLTEERAFEKQWRKNRFWSQAI